MRKIFALIFLLLPFYAFAVAPATTASATLASAKALYFNYKPEESLNAYLEISKNSHDRKAFLNAIYIALELSKPDLAVDTATEKQIRDAFANDLPDCTKIIIAQRISSVKDADEIIVMNDGKITGIGTHAELLENNAEYSEIYYSQMDKKEA